MPPDHAERMMRALISLEGLSVGDAFGERYAVGDAEELIAARHLPRPPWHFTDDTQMALSLYSILRQHGTIDQDALATNFSEHYEDFRGYGHAMNHLVPMIYLTGIWRMMAPRLFSGEGSLGNGAAMRVALLGAYFADDLETVVAQARLSSEVTHTHPEGIAGAIAVAVAAAQAWHLRGKTLPARPEFLDSVLAFMPPSEVAQGITLARDLPSNTSVQDAARGLGSGYNPTAPDSVPFALWAAGECLGNCEEALWLTVAGLGDSDTNCAMVGGIVALSGGADSIPDSWRQAREPLPGWAFHEQNEL
jgi:ADP-ribosylglycohydrolase